MELLERKLPFLNTLLKGVGQIILQENALTGLLFFLGIFYWSILMGLGAVLVVLAGTQTAKVLGYDKEETEQAFCITLVLKNLNIKQRLEQTITD